MKNEKAPGFPGLFNGCLNSPKGKIMRRTFVEQRLEDMRKLMSGQYNTILRDSSGGASYCTLPENPGVSDLKAAAESRYGSFKVLLSAPGRFNIRTGDGRVLGLCFEPLRRSK